MRHVYKTLMYGLETANYIHICGVFADDIIISPATATSSFHEQNRIRMGTERFSILLSVIQ